jgi:hypothetical protein
MNRGSPDSTLSQGMGVDSRSWVRGETVVRREIWRGRPWFARVAVVVEDDDELLATFIPTGAPFAFPASADGRPHPWSGRDAWYGHGVLMLQRPGEACAVWLFWHGAERRFERWYLNLQEPFRRTAIGYDTQDLELDVLLEQDGRWALKDDELLSERVRDGRFTPTQEREIRRLGVDLTSSLDRGERWWDAGWARWVPDPTWAAPTFPGGWEDANVPDAPRPEDLRILGS